MCVLSHIQLSVTPWTAAHQAPLSREFSREESWSGLPFPSPGIFLTQGSSSHVLHWPVDSLPLSHLDSPEQVLQSLNPLWNLCKSCLRML